MKDFGTHAKIENFQLLKHAKADRDSNNYRYAAPMLVDSALVFKSLQKICKRSKTLSDDEINNLETIFCIAEILKESGQEIINIDGQPYSIDTVIKEIQLWLWKIYQQYPFINICRKKAKGNEPLYDKFFQIIAKPNTSDNITVITTNYDLIFEFKAFKNNMLCSYCIKNSNRINAGHGNEEYVALNNSHDKKGPIICKLHGSVNYFYNHDRNDLYVASDLGDKQTIGLSGNWNGKPSIFAVDAIWNIQKKYGETYFPAIIPPTYSKLYNYVWLVEIWNNAFVALKNARRIVFVGYSMPMSDGFMRALMHSAMAFRIRNKAPEVYVIDNDTDTHRRYQDIFKSMYCKIDPQTFLEAVSNGTFEKVFDGC